MFPCRPCPLFQWREQRTTNRGVLRHQLCWPEMSPLRVRGLRRGKVQTDRSQALRESLSHHFRGRVRVGWLFRVVLSCLCKTWFGSESFDSTMPTLTKLSRDVSFLFRAKERCQASSRSLSVCLLPEKLLTTSPFLVQGCRRTTADEVFRLR